MPLSNPVKLSVLALVATFSIQASIAGQSWRDQWEATEVMIPMRDGVKLYTVYFVPKGKPGPFPILMQRTPYGAGSPAQPPRNSNPKLAESGYIFAAQDVRGRGKSEGDYINIKPTLPKGAKGIDESTDTWDTVDYLIKNVPKNSQRVGLWGISYPGFYAGAGAIRNHPALKAVSPQAPVNDWFMGDDVHHRGAFFLQETFDFMLGFDVPRGQPRVNVDRQGMSAYDFFLRAGALSTYDSKFLQGRIPYWFELLENDTENQYWKERALWRSFKDVNCAVLTVGGWYDKEDMYGALKLYDAGEKQNPGIDNFLVMGPWSHGGWSRGAGTGLGDWGFGSNTSKWYQDEVEFRFFERFLKGNTSVPSVADATMFETGVNKWHTFPTWPPKESKLSSVYLSGRGDLSWSKPVLESNATYQYDPAKPTPYVEAWKTSQRAPGDWLAKSQNFLEGRSDTATFWMGPLKDDVRIGGHVFADLWIQTTGTDCDLVVQLLDEYPAETTDKDGEGESMAGRQMMVRGEIMRAKFRNSFEFPEPIRPLVPTRVRFQLNDAFHTFRKGHRIGVRVQSAWFPIADRNPNTFVSRAKAVDADFKPAMISILTGGSTPSRLELGMMPKAN